MDKLGQRVAYEFIASEIGLNYWSVWWEALFPKAKFAGQIDGATLRCEINGVVNVDAAIKAVREVAKELNIGLPALQRKGRNTT